MQARFHRAGGLADRRGDLALRQFEVVAQVQHDAVVLGQLADRTEERLRFVAGGDRRVGRFNAPRCEYADAADQPGPSRARPHFVEGQVRHDPQQPWPEGLASPEGVQPLIRADEGVLRHVFGGAGVAQDEICRTKGDLLVTLDERAERSGVTGRSPLDCLRFVNQHVVHVPDLHRPAAFGSARDDKPHHRVVRLRVDLGDHAGRFGPKEHRMRKVAVVGAGMTRFGKHQDKTLKDLGREAVEAAMKEAGVDKPQIEAAMVGNATAGLITGQEMIRAQVILRDHRALFG